MNVNEQLDEDKVAKKLLELQAYAPFLEQLIASLKKKNSVEKVPNPNQLRNIETLYNIISAKEKKSKIGLSTLVKCEAVLLKIADKVDQISSFGTVKSLTTIGSQSKVIKCKKPLDMESIPDIWRIKSHSYQKINYRDSRPNDSFMPSSSADYMPTTSINSNKWIDTSLKKNEGSEIRYDRSNVLKSKYRRSSSRNSTHKRSKSPENIYNRSISRSRNRRSRSRNPLFSRHDRSTSKDKSLSRSRRASRGRSNRRSWSFDKISRERSLSTSRKDCRGIIYRRSRSYEISKDRSLSRSRRISRGRSYRRSRSYEISRDRSLSRSRRISRGRSYRRSRSYEISKERSLSRSRRISRGRSYRRSRSIDRISKDGSLSRCRQFSRGRSYRRSRSINRVSKDRSLSGSRRVSRGRSYRRSRSVDKVSPDRSFSRSRRVSRERSYRRSRSINEVSKDRSLSRSKRVSRDRSHRRSRSFNKRCKDRSLSRSSRVSRGRSFRRSRSIDKRSVLRDTRKKRSISRISNWDSSSSMDVSAFRSKRHRSKSFDTHSSKISKDIKYDTSRSREAVFKSTQGCDRTDSNDKSRSKISKSRDNSNDTYLSRQSFAERKEYIKRSKSPKSKTSNSKISETRDSDSNGPKPLLRSDEPDWDIDDNETELKCFQAFPLKLGNTKNNSVDWSNSCKPILIISDSDSSEPTPSSSLKKKTSAMQKKHRQTNEDCLVYSDISECEELPEGKRIAKIDKSLLPIESSEWERKSLMKKNAMVSAETIDKNQTKQDKNVMKNEIVQKAKPLLLTDDEDWDVDEVIEGNSLNSSKGVDLNKEEVHTHATLQPPPEIPQFIKNILENFEAKQSDSPPTIFERLGNKIDFTENFKVHVKNDKLENSKSGSNQTLNSPKRTIDSISSNSGLNTIENVQCSKDSQLIQQVLTDTAEQTLPPPPDIIAPEIVSEVLPPPPKINFIENNRLAYKYNPHPRRSNLAVDHTQDNNSGLCNAGSKEPNVLQKGLKPLDPRLRSLQTNPNLIQIKTVNMTENSKFLSNFEISTCGENIKKNLKVCAEPKTYGEYRRRTEREREQKALTNKLNNSSGVKLSSDDIQTKNLIAEEKNNSKKEMKEFVQQNLNVTSVNNTSNAKYNPKKDDRHKKLHSSGNRKDSFNIHSNLAEVDKNKNGKNRSTSEQTLEKSSSNCNEKSSTSVTAFKIPKKNLIEKETGPPKNQTLIPQLDESKRTQSANMKSEKEDRNKTIENSALKDKLKKERHQDHKDRTQNVPALVKPVERIQRDPRLQFSKLIKEKQSYSVVDNIGKTGIIIKKVTSCSKPEIGPHENTLVDSKSLLPNVVQSIDQSSKPEDLSDSSTSVQEELNTPAKATDNNFQLTENKLEKMSRPIRKRRKSVFDIPADNTEVSTQNIITGKRKTRSIVKMSDSASTSSSPITDIATENEQLKKNTVVGSVASSSNIKPDITEYSQKETNDIPKESQKNCLLDSFLTDNPSVNKMSVLGMLSKVLDEKKFGQVKKIIENEDMDDDEIVKHNSYEDDNLLQPSAAEKRRSCRHKTELDRLNEDVRDMFISKEVLMATGKRNCATTKKVHPESIKLDNDKIKTYTLNNKKQALDKNEPNYKELYSLRSLKVNIKRINLNDLNTNALQKKKSKRRRDGWARGNIKKKKKKNVAVLNSKSSKLSKIFEPAEMIESSSMQNLPKSIRPCPKSKKLISNLPSKVSSSIDLNVILQGKSFDHNLKNIYPEIHSKSVYATYCVLCGFNGDQITNHYILYHTKFEVYTSRLPSSIVADLLEDKNNVPAYCFRGKKNFCYLYQCPFCDLELTLNRKNWINHFTTHTGEYLFKCTSCRMVMNKTETVHTHKKLFCPKGEIVQNSYYGKNFKVVQGLLCEICNFVQMVQVNMLNHLKLQHNCRSNRYKIVNLVNFDNVMKIEKGDENAEIDQEKSLVNAVENDIDEPKVKENEDCSQVKEISESNKTEVNPAIHPSVPKRRLSNNGQDNTSKKRKKINEKDIETNAEPKINIREDETQNESNKIIDTTESLNELGPSDVGNKNISMVDESSTKFKSPNEIKYTKSLTSRNSGNNGILIIDPFDKASSNKSALTDQLITNDSNNCSSSSASLIIDESYESEKNSGTDVEFQEKEKANTEDADDDEWEDMDIESQNSTGFEKTSAKAVISKDTLNSKDKKNKTILQKLSKLYAAMKPKSIILKRKIESPGKCLLTDEDKNRNDDSNPSDYIDKNEKTSDATKILSLSPEPLKDLNDISNLLESTDLDSMGSDGNICKTIDVLGLTNELDIVDLTEIIEPVENIPQTEEIIETTEYRINNVGFRVLPNKTVKYICLVPNCTFLFSEQLYGIQSHFVLDHPNSNWDGFCYCCEKKIPCDELTLGKELSHMEDSHVKNLKLHPSNQTEEIRPRITVRRLSGDLLSTVHVNTLENTVQEPSATNIQEPSATNIQEPSATSIQEASATNIQEPSATNIQDPSATNNKEQIDATNLAVNEIPTTGSVFSIPRFPNLIVKKMNHDSTNGLGLKLLLNNASKPLSPSALNNKKLSIMPNENNNGEKNTANKNEHEENQNIQNKTSTSNEIQIVSVSGGVSVLNGITVKKTSSSTLPAEKPEKSVPSSSHETRPTKPKFKIVSQSKLITKQLNEKNVFVIPSLQISNVVSLSNAVDSTINNAITTRPSTSANLVSAQSEVMKANFLKIQNVFSLNETPESANLQTNTKEYNSEQILKPWCNKAIPKPLEISKLQLRPISLFARFKCMSSNCFFTTENENTLVNHFALHTCSRSETPNDWLECSYCNFIANNNQEYFSHFTKKHEHDIFQCPFCFYRSCNDFCVLKHLSLYHENDKNKVIYVVTGERKKLTDDIKMLAINRIRYVNNIQCRDCGKVFYIIQNFLNHIAAVHKSRKFVCCLCSQYIDIWTGAPHFLKEHSIANYQCIYCTFATSVRQTIVEHLVNKHPSNLMYACYRISPMKNTPVLFETIDNSTVLENMNAVIGSSCFQKCTFNSDELNFMSPSLDPKSIQNNKNATPSILNKTKYIMNLDISEADLESLKDCFSSPTNIKIISVKSLSEIQNESNCSTSDSSSKQNPYNVNTTSFAEASALLPVSVDTNEIIVDEHFCEDLTMMNKILEAFKNIVSKTGFNGSKLYICPYCSSKKIVCNNGLDYNLHLNTFHSNNQIFRCPHCQFQSGRVKHLCSHLLTHRKHQYLCYYCNYSAVFKSNLVKHVFEEHSKNYKSLQDISIGGTQLQSYKIICPKGITKQEVLEYGKRLIRFAENKTPSSKRSFHSNELDLLPYNSIFDQEIMCAECNNYRTTIRTNMVRHLMTHLNNSEKSVVPSSEPVNPVPSLDTNDKPFDKMINLACSSNQNKELVCTETLIEESNNEKTGEIEVSIEPNDSLEKINAKIPVFVEKSKLFVCGVSNCKYTAQYDYMLKCHLQTLHLDEKEYICPHCTKIMYKNVNSIDTIMQHYKFHDSTIYVCNECIYMHYEKGLVESHIKNAHPNQTIDLLTYQRTDIGEVNETMVKTQQNLEENSNTSDDMEWKCNFCKYYAKTFNKMNIHSYIKHGVSSRYTCPYCKLGSGTYNIIMDHVKKQHPNMNLEIKSAYSPIRKLSKPAKTNASSSCNKDSSLVNNEEALKENQNEESRQVPAERSEENLSSKQMECNELLQKNSKSSVVCLPRNKSSSDNMVERPASSHLSDSTAIKLDIYVCFYCSFKNISFKAIQHHWCLHHNSIKNRIRKPFSFQIFGYMSNESIECQRPDISSEHLLRVLRCGTKTKRFQCNKCWKLFADSESVTEHQRLVHPNFNKLQTLLFYFQAFYVCNICEYASLLEHKTAAHLLNHYEYMKKCHLCNEFYESIISFIKHLSKHDVTLYEFLAMDDKIVDFWNEMYVYHANGFCVKKKNIIKPYENSTSDCLQKVNLEFSKIISAETNVGKTIIINDTEKESVIGDSSTSSAKTSSIKRKANQQKKPKKRSKKTAKDFVWLPYEEKCKSGKSHLQLSSSSSSNDSSTEFEDDSDNQQNSYKIPNKAPPRRQSMFLELPPKIPPIARRRATVYYENPIAEGKCFVDPVKEQKKKPVPRCMQHLSREQLIPYSFYGKKPKDLDLSTIFTTSPENNETTITVEMFSILNPIDVYVSVEKLNPDLLSNKEK